MKRLVRALCALALAVATAAAVAAPALAKSYDYEVRVFPGNQGTISAKNGAYVDGNGVGILEHVKPGTDVTLGNYFSVTPQGKYHFKGFRISGQDNLDGLWANFVVNEDTDFVVAYSVPGNMVKYTVHFVEYGTGTPLQNDEGNTSREYEGKIGDVAVVAYDYVPGYRPLYRNIRQTLKADPTNSGVNDLTFEYVSLTAGGSEGGSSGGTTTVTGGGTTTTTTVTGGGTTTGTTGGEAGAEGTAGGEAGTTGDEGTTGGNEGTSTGDESTTTVQPAPETQDILDVDNPLAAPTATPDGGTTDTTTEPTKPTKPQTEGIASKLGMIPFMAIVATVMGLAGYLLYRILKDRAAEEEDEDEL